ncbi:hypothetical protein [Telluribacter humicola]|uniref:hypothetical protein n=1 Tax=Telluribacter humicola TaxID=1720261 RepID=UPI001A95FBBE|nr:hypothetical protein [Telluribacter humicola]
MKIGAKLQKQLDKKYAPSSTIAARFERYDVTMVTDEEGNPTLLYIGDRGEDGTIKKGYRFTRTLIKDPNGKVIKDHWDNHGKI